MAFLRVKRRGFTRKGGVHVRGATFKIKDRGSRGRGNKVIPDLKKGSLGVSFDQSPNVRHSKEAKLAARIGEKKVLGKLQAVAVFNKRTNQKVAAKARSDRKWIAGRFIGHKRVQYPGGFA